MLLISHWIHCHLVILRLGLGQRFNGFPSVIFFNVKTELDFIKDS